MAKYSVSEIWSALESLRYNPVRTKEYFGFVGAQGNAIAIKGERGIVLDSEEGVILTNSTDAARYMTGDMGWSEIRPQRKFQVDIDQGRVLTAWVESDRFVTPCKCRAIPIENYIRIGGEDDCSVHGFGEEDGEE